MGVLVSSVVPRVRGRQRTDRGTGWKDALSEDPGRRLYAQNKHTTTALRRLRPSHNQDATRAPPASLASLGGILRALCVVPPGVCVCPSSDPEGGGTKI